MALKDSFTAIRFYVANDVYFYTTDNRPLTDVKACLDLLADTLDTGFTTGTILAGNGTVSAPSYSFTASPNLGWYNPGGAASQTIGLAVPSSNKALLLGSTIGGNLGLALQSGGQIVWSTGSDPAGTLGLLLTNGGSGILEQRNGVNGQTFRLYNTFTDASNYERLALVGGGSQLDITSQAAGTGVVRTLRMYTGGSAEVHFGTNSAIQWKISTSGHWLANTDNTTDIGALGATRPRTGYFGTSVNTPVITSSTSANLSIATNAGASAQWDIIHSGGALLPQGDNLRDFGATVNRVRSAYLGSRVVLGDVTITYSASMTPDASLGNFQTITATNGTAFTINAPTNPIQGQLLVITLRNTSGGALGVATWNAVFKMAAWTNPATANSRTIYFKYDGTNWIEQTRTAADIPN